jgi:type I restriction enzyme M protein
MNGDGSVKHPGLDNHGMGTVFEELVHRFNEENNEEAGEHWTPRDAVKLMAKLILLPIADAIESGTYLLYDGACGTGGMLTVAEETLQALAAAHGKQVATHLFGQEINAETYTICKADLLLKGDGDAADNIVGGPEHSTLSNDAFPSREFDFMLSNPPYGKSWKGDLERMGGKGGIKDLRFVRREVLPHAPDAWYVPDSVKIGYEISFTRYFYKPQPLRTLEEIRADILALERETEGLLQQILLEEQP